MSQPKMLSYVEFRQQQRNHWLHVSEIPTEHATSLPLPTKRWGEPAYAFFASPAARRPGEARTQAGPDRWWVVSASNNKLIMYALWRVMPYAEGAQWGTITLPRINRSIEELDQLFELIESLINTLAPDFWAGEPGNPETRKDLSRALGAYLPEPLMPQYRALTPDFFAWLDGPASPDQ